MSRNKKSRKPGVGSSGALKESAKTEVVAPEKRIKKHKGKQPGNRQKEAHKEIVTQSVNLNKDPRLGSKKPIDLGQTAKKKSKQTAKQVISKTPIEKTNKPKQAPIAAIRTVEPADDQVNLLTQELEAIEQDERILAILSKQEDELSLNEDEIDYFNDKMERHQEICEILGISDDEDEEEENDHAPTRASEDELWDKFDNSDLSKFE